MAAVGCTWSTRRRGAGKGGSSPLVLFGHCVSFVRGEEIARGSGSEGIARIPRIARTLGEKTSRHLATKFDMVHRF